MHPQRVGIVGVPPLSVISELNRNKCTIFDLDEPQTSKSISLSSQYLPKVYCAILRTVVLNALNLELDAIYIDVGPGKCDCALHVAMVLEDLIQIPIIKPVILTTNHLALLYAAPECLYLINLLQSPKLSNLTHLEQSSVPALQMLDSGEFPPEIFLFSPCFRTPLTFTAGQGVWKIRLRPTLNSKLITIQV